MHYSANCRKFIFQVFRSSRVVIDLLRNVAIDQSEQAIPDSLLWRLLEARKELWETLVRCVVRQLLRSTVDLEFVTSVSKLHSHLGLAIFRRFYGPVKENDLGNRER